MKMNGCRIQGDLFNEKKKKKSYPYAWMIGVKRCQLKNPHHWCDSEWWVNPSGVKWKLRVIYSHHIFKEWVWPLPTPTLSSGLWATQVITICLLTTKTASFNWVHSSPALPVLHSRHCLCALGAKSPTKHTQKQLHCTRVWHNHLPTVVLDVWVKKEVWT